MAKSDRLCPNCYYNSENDFFDPGFDASGKSVEQCHWDKQYYPHARMCDKYEAADRDPEAEG